MKNVTGSVMVAFGSGREYTEEYWVESASQISCGEVIRFWLTFSRPIPPFTIWFLWT